MMRIDVAAYIGAASNALKSLEDSAGIIEKAAEILADVLRGGGKILLLGCGGSAADAQHIATELVCRFRKDRRPLPAMALTTDTSLITAVSNDYSFSEVFSRQVDAFASEKDAVILISTSGNSESVIRAAAVAREKNAKTIALTGKGGGKLEKYTDILIEAPTEVTSHAQECHIAIGHILCLLIENKIFPDA